MAQRTVSKPEYKEIVKKYNLLCGAHQLWELWQDSMTMYALSISNAVDGRFREQREKAYVDIAHKYTKEEMQVFPQILGEIVMQLEAKPEQDLLGHGSVNVTQIYLRQSQEQQKAVVDSVVNW